MKKRIVAAVMAVAMLINAPVVGTNPSRVAKAGADKEIIEFSSEEMLAPEGTGTLTLSVKRSGITDRAREIDINLYDISTTYGEDYVLDCDEDVKTFASTSMFDAFRTKSTEVSKEAEAASLLGANPTTSDDETNQNGFAALEDIGAKAASIRVSFDKNETKKEISIKIKDDSKTEYDETFLMGISVPDNASDKKSITTGMTTVCIKDNEKVRPSNTISFADRGGRMKNGETAKRVYFERSGNLAVISKAVLSKDGQPYGYISFVPYQKKQCAMLPSGEYSLVSSGTAEVGGEHIFIRDPKGKVSDKKASKKELDKLGLDDVPEYSKYSDDVALSRKMDPASWFPDWAKTATTSGTYEDNSSLVVGGTSGNQIFWDGAQDGLGDLSYDSGENKILLDTHGTGSRASSSYMYGNGPWEDLTGFESVETKAHAEGINGGDANLKLGIQDDPTICEYSREVSTNGDYDLSVGIPEKCQRSGFVYICNEDPSWKDDGTQVYFPNAFRLAKREYLVQIKQSNELKFIDDSGDMAPVTYDAGDTKQQYLKMALDKNKVDSKIEVKLTNEANYPFSLRGYRVENNTGLKTDEMAINSSHTIDFDQKFLKDYENSYAFKTQANGKDSYAFYITPVVEKIGVNYRIEGSAGGTLKLEKTDENGKLYKGDYAIFSGTSTLAGADFKGVDIYRKKAGETDYHKINYSPESDGKVRLRLDTDFDDYIFQGVFKSYKNQITVGYAPGAEAHGKVLAGQDGVVVKSDRYTANGYATLEAQPNSGYLTKWTSNGRTWYGNTLYYQMDGNPDNDNFTVDFVEASQAKQGTLSGGAYTLRVNLLDSARNWREPLEGKQITINADKTYTATVAKDGSFEIPNFTGVEGGRYTANIKMGSEFGYAIFTWQPGQSITLEIPEFCNMPFYPLSVSAGINGVGSTSQDINLTSNSNVDFLVKVRKSEPDSEVDKVVLHFYNLDENGDKHDDAYQVEITQASTGGDGTDDIVAFQAAVSTDKLPKYTHVYVEVVGKRSVYYSGDTKELVDYKTGEVDAGYNLFDEGKNYDLPVYQELPYQNGIQEGESVDWSALQLDFLGCLDFSLSGKGGGYFISQQANADTYYLIAGFNITSYWAPSVIDSHEAAVNTRETLMGASEKEEKKGDTKEAAVNETTDNSNTTKGKPKFSKTVQPVLKVMPTFMLKFTVKAYFDESGEQHMYIAAFDVAVGFDERLIVNIPFTVYGVPFYVNFMFDGEQYMQWETSFPNSDKTQLDNASLEEAEKIETREYLELSKTKINLKGGLGYNNLVGVYLSGMIDPKVLGAVIKEVGSDNPKYDAGGQLDWSVGVGADMAIFNMSLNLGSDIGFGNEELRERIMELSAANATKAARKTVASNDFSLGVTDGSDMDLSAKMNQSSFGLIRNSSDNMRVRASSSTGAASTLIGNTFRGADIKLVRLAGDKMMAVGLEDNGAKSSSYNYLSAVTAVSADNGKTWNATEKISESSNLQYNVKFHKLDDKVLLTWSEGDMDKVLGDKDPTKDSLNASEVAKAMNEFTLKGRFYNLDGTPDGDAFDVVTDSGVTTTALQANEHEGKIYLYYQRSNFDENKDVQATELFSQQNTISYVTIERGETTTVTPSSEQILARSKDGSKAYRIMEIQPFSYNGIVGDVLVIDRDGKLLEKNSAGGNNYSIDDRQIFLRINDVKGNKLEQGTLIPLTDKKCCAQNIHIERTGDHIYLFYICDGRVKVLKDFVSSGNEAETTDFVSKTVCYESDSLTKASDLSVSMNDKGNVLLAWIGNKDGEVQKNSDGSSAAMRNEVYGTMLTADSEGNFSVKGKPVALTSHNKTLNRLDCLAVNDKDFVLAYTMLNGDSVYDSTQASVMTEGATYTSNLEITDIDAPEYPTPGQTMSVDVTVKNNGLKPADNVNLSASGITARRPEDTGNSSIPDDGVLYPGQSRTYRLLMDVPSDLNADKKIMIKAKDSMSESEKDMTIKYGSYFVPVGYPSLENIANTKDYAMTMHVKNIGNKPGAAKIEYTDAVVGCADKDAMHTGTIESNQSLAPGSSGTIKNKVSNTVGRKSGLVSLKLRMGKGYDQAVETVLPNLKKGSAKKRNVYGLAKGKTFTQGNFKYKVTKKATNSQNGEVSVISLSKKGKKAKNLKLGDTVKLAGKSGKYLATKYKIKTLGSKTFKKAKAKKIQLNKYINQIPGTAFNYCKKLTSLSIKKKLKKASKKAFKGCKKRIKVSGASKKTNKKNVKILKKGVYKKFYA
ncbi:MAG: leucine-rich repeat protein [Eubacterium sp.]|nr:leucine-rich repeat protein [Eubacterium sp.]